MFSDFIVYTAIFPQEDAAGCRVLVSKALHIHPLGSREERPWFLPKK